MKLNINKIKEYKKYFVFIILIINLIFIISEKPLLAQDTENASSSAILSDNSELKQKINLTNEKTTECFSETIASYTLPEQNELISLSDITEETSVGSESVSIYDETIEWLNKGFNSFAEINNNKLIASETASVAQIKELEIQTPDNIINKIISRTKLLLENNYFNCVRDYLKNIDTVARLDLPSDVNLLSVKDLNQNFRFIFPCEMMSFQSACATITPGLIKEEIWSKDYKSLVIVPEQMKMSTEYTLIIATATLNAEGMPLKEAAIVNFKTFSPEPASITMITPLNNATNVATGATIVLHFSKEIIWDSDASPASFSVYNESSMQNVPLCPITAFNKKTLALIPENDLDIESNYSVNILSGIKTYVEGIEEDQPEVASATFTFSTSF